MPVSGRSLSRASLLKWRIATRSEPSASGMTRLDIQAEPSTSTSPVAKTAARPSARMRVRHPDRDGTQPHDVGVRNETSRWRFSCYQCRRRAAGRDVADFYSGAAQRGSVREAAARKILLTMVCTLSIVTRVVAHPVATHVAEGSSSAAAAADYSQVRVLEPGSRGNVVDDLKA